MACPFFFPTGAIGSAPSGRTPLGVLCRGECHSPASCPTDVPLHLPCNHGYGKFSCPSFPPQAFADAVRFDWRGGELIFIYERDFQPVSHGLVRTATDPVLKQQASMFEAYWGRLLPKEPQT